jgi:hypothetical protein
LRVHIGLDIPAGDCGARSYAEHQPGFRPLEAGVLRPSAEQAVGRQSSRDRVDAPRTAGSRRAPDVRLCVAPGYGSRDPGVLPRLMIVARLQRSLRAGRRAQHADRAAQDNALHTQRVKT